MAQQDDAPVELPGITKVEYPTRVGEDRRPAVVIWFDNDTALRYVWNDAQGEIEEQTYADGVVHDSARVGGTREELEDYALQSISEYINDLRDDPEACKFDWGNVYDMLVRQ